VPATSRLSGSPPHRLCGRLSARSVGRTRVRVSLLCLVVVASAGVAAPDVAAHVSFTASMAPARIHYPQTREVVYRLTMTTGLEGERFTVDLRSPLWSTGLPLGSPVRLNGPPTLEGPGALARFEARGGRSFGAGVQGCARGYPEAHARVEVALPPSSTSTLVARYATGKSPPWPGADLRVTFVARGMSGGGPNRVETVRPPMPRLTGRLGARLVVRTRPGRASRGQRVLVEGRTDRGLAGDRVALWAAAYVPDPSGAIPFEGPHYPADFRPARRLGVVRVGPRGGFRLRGWRPRLEAGYRVWAVYPRQRARRLPDRSCPAWLTVGNPEGRR
jgi:hypothetical protein